MDEVKYDEGHHFGYRWYDKNKVKPAYPFGHGLSYTNFSIDYISASRNGVKVNVTNTGKALGKEIV